MNENINLCELLKDHIGETFYSTIIGNVVLLDIKNTGKPIIVDGGYNLFSSGKVNINGECILFPSKDQRDWNKWAEEQKLKVPKTWNELCQLAQVEQIEVSIDVIFDDEDNMMNKSHAVGRNSKLAKSALALLKIHQLIEVGYDGNVTNEEWKYLYTDRYTIEYSPTTPNDIFSIELADYFNHIAFHTKEQAEEFMSYPENVQLVKDFYMI